MGIKLFGIPSGHFSLPNITLSPILVTAQWLTRTGFINVYFLLGLLLSLPPHASCLHPVHSPDLSSSISSSVCPSQSPQANPLFYIQVELYFHLLPTLYFTMPCACMHVINN